MTEQFNMWKEINEIPGLVESSLDAFNANAAMDFDYLLRSKISNIKLVSSGSSNNACQTARYIFEEIIKIPTTIEYASEFAHKTYVLGRNTLVIGVSQSGKTADTLEALRKIKSETGCHILAMTNIQASPLYEISDSRILIGAGSETAIPATKSFTLQLLALFNLAILIADNRKINTEKVKILKQEMTQISKNIQLVMEQADKLKDLAEMLVKKEHLVILARGINHAIAREGALKFKETCYIDANGYPAGEFMHGYMAMLDKKANVLVLEHTNDDYLVANVLKLRKSTEADIYGLSMSGDNNVLYDKFIDLPVVNNKLVSIFSFTAALQIMAYYGAVSLGYNPDIPRNLTKYLEKEK